MGCDAVMHFRPERIDDHGVKLLDLNIFRVKAGLCDYTTEMAAHVAKIARILA